MADLNELFKAPMYRTQLEISQILTKGQIPFIVVPLRSDGSDFLALFALQQQRLETLSKNENGII